MSNEDGPKGGSSAKPKLRLIPGGLKNRSDFLTPDNFHVSHDYDFFPDNDVEEHPEHVFSDNDIERFVQYFDKFSLDEVYVLLAHEGEPIQVMLKKKSQIDDFASNEDHVLEISPGHIEIIFQIHLGNYTEKSPGFHLTPSIEFIIDKFRKIVELKPEFMKLGYVETIRGLSKEGPYYEYHLKKLLFTEEDFRRDHKALLLEIESEVEDVMTCLSFEKKNEKEPA